MMIAAFNDWQVKTGQASKCCFNNFLFSDFIMYFEGLLGTIFSFLTLVKAEWNTKDFQKREHSLVKPYQGSGFGVPNWDFQVSTNYSLFSCHFDLDIQEPILFMLREVQW